MSKLQTLFAAPIRIDDDVLTDRLDYIENVCKLKIEEYELKEYSHDKFNTNVKYVTHKIDELKIHKIKEFNFVCEEILKRSKEFLEQYGYSGDVIDNLRIDGSWFNYTAPGDMLHYHTHRAALMTVLMYIKTDEKVDFVRFVKNLYDAQILPNNPNIFSKTYEDISVKPGRVLMFLASQAHGTERQQSDERLVLVFNLKS